MSFYNKFAYFYTKGQYPQYSEKMVELLPPVLARFDAQPQTILDIACGEGSFAVAMAKRVGIMRSHTMTCCSVTSVKTLSNNSGSNPILR